MTPSELENWFAIEQDEEDEKVISSTCEMESFSSSSGICGRPATHIWNNKECGMPVCDRCLLCVAVCGGDLKPIPKENNQKRKVGIIGGSFDPITIGHIELAKFVLSNKIVDDIWLMPCSVHASKDITTPNGQRLKMCKIATDNCPNIFVSTYELDYSIPAGTINLFNHLCNNKFYSDYEFYFVIGMDNANNIHKWIKYAELLQKAKFIVVPRKGCSRNVNVDWYLNPPHIFLVSPHEIPNISSTEVRDEIRMLKELEDSSEPYDLEAYDLLETFLQRSIGDEILQYIKEHKIY